MDHMAPMLSLEATREEDEVRRFDERTRKSLNSKVRYLLEEKFDGASIELVYESGILTRAVTRGDGREGEEVTENVKTIRSVPLRLHGEDRKAPKLLALRGEVMMKIPAFESLNRKLLEAGNEPSPIRAMPQPAPCASSIPASPRSGLLRHRLRGPGGRGRAILHGFPGAQIPRGVELPTPRRIFQVSTLSEIVKHHAQLAEERDRLPYEIDGMVIKLDDLDAREKLGSTAHHPRWAIAYKFAPRGDKTRIEQIAIQVGRTGVLTPVALMRPVEVGGVTISRATLHNREEVQRKDLRVGDWVRIQRAGDVIPEVVERIAEPGRKREPPFKMPSKCPACSSQLVERGPYTVCPNRFACPAQLKGRLKHFAFKGGLDIEGLGEETVSALIDRRLVSDLADLFRLNKNDLLRLERFAERSASSSLTRSRRAGASSLGGSFTIWQVPAAGVAVARDLAQKFRSLERLETGKPTRAGEHPGDRPKDVGSDRRVF